MFFREMSILLSFVQVKYAKVGYVVKRVTERLAGNQSKQANWRAFTDEYDDKFTVSYRCMLKTYN